MNKFQVGDKVRLRDERVARSHNVWEQTGTVTAIVEDGTSAHRITVDFPNEIIEGMAAGKFERAS